jgi:hypothetical protein
MRIEIELNHHLAGDETLTQLRFLAGQIVSRIAAKERENLLRNSDHLIQVENWREDYKNIARMLNIDLHEVPGLYFNA